MAGGDNAPVGSSSRTAFAAFLGVGGGRIIGSCSTGTEASFTALCRVRPGPLDFPRRRHRRQSPEAHGAELARTGPGLPAPRWVSYYLDIPVWELDEGRFGDVADPDIVIVRASRVPEFFPADALTEPLASVGDFFVITAESLSRQRRTLTSGITSVNDHTPEMLRQPWPATVERIRLTSSVRFTPE